MLARAGAFGLPTLRWEARLNSPAGLTAELTARGAVLGTAIDVLACDLRAGTPALPPASVDVKVRWATDLETSRDGSVVGVTGFGGMLPPEDRIEANAARDAATVPVGKGGMLVAYVDGLPAGSGGVTLADDVARLWGGVVVPAARGQGVYRAVLGACRCSRGCNRGRGASYCYPAYVAGESQPHSFGVPRFLRGLLMRGLRVGITDPARRGRDQANVSRETFCRYVVTRLRFAPCLKPARSDKVSDIAKGLLLTEIRVFLVHGSASAVPHRDRVEGVHHPLGQLASVQFFLYAGPHRAGDRDPSLDRLRLLVMRTQTEPHPGQRVPPWLPDRAEVRELVVVAVRVAGPAEPFLDAGKLGRQDALPGQDKGLQRARHSAVAIRPGVDRNEVDVRHRRADERGLIEVSLVEPSDEFLG